MNDYKQIKNLIVKLEKKERELASYKAKVTKTEKEVNEIKSKLNSLLNTQQTTSIPSFN